MNQKIPDSDVFTNITLYDDCMSYSAYDVPQYFKCFWCGGNSMYLLSRTSRMTGNIYTDHCCSNHAKEFGFEVTL